MQMVNRTANHGGAVQKPSVCPSQENEILRSCLISSRKPWSHWRDEWRQKVFLGGGHACVPIVRHKTDIGAVTLPVGLEKTEDGMHS